MPSGRVVLDGFNPAQDLNGQPIVGTQAFFYLPGTETLTTVYTTDALDVAHANPLVSDSAGRFAEVFADPGLTFDIRVRDADDAQIGFLTAVRAIGAPGDVSAEQLETAVGEVVDPLLTGLANVGLDNATIPLIGDFQPPAPVYHRKRALVISDFSDYDDDPNALNDAAFAEMLSDATDQYASGEIAIVEPIRLAGTTVGSQKVGITAPQDVKIVSGDNMDASLTASRLWSGGKARIVCADDVTQGIVASEGSKFVGLNVIKNCVNTPPTSISDYLDRLGDYLGDALTADSLPGFEAHDMTFVGWARTGVVLGCERFNISRLKADCLAGLEILSIFDVAYLTQISQWPLYGVGWLRTYLGAVGSANYAARKRLYDMCLVRPGTGLKLAPVGGIGTGTGADGVIVNGYMSFGYNTKAVHVIDGNACMLRNMWPDHVFSLQSTAAQAAAYAALSSGAKTTTRADTLSSALTEATGVGSGFNFDTYNAHPLYGTIQALGVVTEGNCQNTQISGTHVDSHAKNYAFLHTAGTVGPIISGCTTGQARLAQLELGDNKGTIQGFQYAGGADDAAIIVGTSVEDWALSGINGVASTAANAIRYGNPVNAKNVRFVDPWRHNGTIQSTLLVARPTGNPAPTTGSFQPVIFATETTDRLAEHSTSTGIYTAKYPGTLATKAWIVFSPAGATGGQHVLRLKQNGGVIKSVFIRTESTAQYSLNLELDVTCNPGDTLSYEIFHEVAATWSGAECGVEFRSTTLF